MGDRDVGDVVARGDDVVGQAFALGADDERDLAVELRAAARPRGRRARSRRPGSSATSRTRATGTENSAPIEARTALWPYGSALPGPSATLRRRRTRARERITVPTLPGSFDAPQRDAARAGGRRPALRVDADRARAGAELRDRRRARAARTGMPVEPAARRRVARGRVPAGGVGRLAAGPRPRPRTRPACRASAFRRACGSP